MSRPKLFEIPLPEIKAGGRYITMSEGQWDALLSEAYQRFWILIEVNEDERPVRAYQMQASQ